MGWVAAPGGVAHSGKITLPNQVILLESKVGKFGVFQLVINNVKFILGKSKGKIPISFIINP